MCNRLVIFILLTSLCGCAGMSKEDNDKFQKDVAKNVSAGMSVITALEHLANAGFSCDERSVASKITCTRMRENILLYSCIQRVNISVDSSRKIVDAVDPDPIACAGM